VEAELSGLVRAGKLPPKRGWSARMLLGSAPVVH
jgi:hypothetical protein